MTHPTQARRALRGVADALLGMLLLGGIFMGFVLLMVGLAYLVLLAELALSAFLVFGWPWWLPRLLRAKPNPEMGRQIEASRDHVRWLKASGHAYSRERQAITERWIEEENARLRL